MKTKLMAVVAIAIVVFMSLAAVGRVFAIDPPVTVNISGKVLVHVTIGAGPYAPNGPFEFDAVNHVEAHAIGTLNALQGKGAQGPGEGNILDFSSGFVTGGDKVALYGTIAKSNNPHLIGAPVEVTADLSTGAITYSVGPAFGDWKISALGSGSGTVVLNNA